MTDSACPFCYPAGDQVYYRDSLVIGIWDGFPVTPGHALLVPIRHVPTWFDASVDERMALIRAIDAARLAIESNFGADGYNIGINNGEAAGQTVPHLHVHVIPRRRGDMATWQIRGAAFAMLFQRMPTTFATLLRHRFPQLVTPLVTALLLLVASTTHYCRS